MIENVDGINEIIRNLTLMLGVGILADYCLTTVEFFNRPDKLESKLSLFFPITTLSIMMIAASVTQKVCSVLQIRQGTFILRCLLCKCRSR